MVKRDEYSAHEDTDTASGLGDGRLDFHGKGEVTSPVIDAMEEGLAIIDKEGRLEYVNPALADMLGGRPTEIVGKSMASIVLPEDRPLFGREVSLPFTRSDPSRVIGLVRPDGSVVRVNVTHMQRRPGEEFSGMMALFSNATNRHIADVEIEDSEWLLANIIDFLPDPTFVLDRKRKVIAWNRAIEKMTGVRKSEVVGKGDMAYSTPFYGTEKPMLVDLILSDEDVGSQYYNVKKEGDIIFAEVYAPALYEGRGCHLWIAASPLFDQSGDIVGAIETVRDITERREMETELRDSEAKYRYLVERAEDGIAIIQDGTIRYANPSLSEMWGGSPEAVVGMDFSNFIHLDEKRKVTENHALRMAGVRVSSIYETVLRRADGEKAYVELNAGRIPYNGSPADLVIVREITERKKAEDEIRRLYRLTRDILDKAPFGIYVVNGEGDVEYMNPAIVAISGDTPEQFMGFNVFDLPTYKSLGLSEKIRGVLKKESFFLGPVEYTSHFAKKTSIRNFTGIPFEEGQETKALVFVEDVTEQKRAEEELRKNEEMLAVTAKISYELLTSSDFESALDWAVESLGLAARVDLVFIFENSLCPDSGSRIMNLRLCWSRKTGDFVRNNPAFQGIFYDEIFPEGHELTSDGRTVMWTSKNLPPAVREIHGFTVPIRSLLIVPIVIEDLSWGFIGFADCQTDRNWDEVDVSVLNLAAQSIGGAIVRHKADEEVMKARQELEARVVERTAELEAKNAEMERFIYTVSHDLRSPLFTVAGFIGLLRKDFEMGNQDLARTDLRVIEGAIAKMDAQLTNTLELSRIGRVSSPPRTISLGDVLEDALGQVSERLRTNGVEISIESELPEVYADRMRITEVIVNLIENSIKYMGDQAHPRISVGHTVDGEETKFFVRDNGMGIDPSQHKKVFDLFYQVDRGNEGTGAGLAIVKRIIEVHQGRIWIESEVSSGCTVWFTLPAACSKKSGTEN